MLCAVYGQFALVLLRDIQWEEGGVQHVFFGGSGSPFYWFAAVARSVNLYFAMRCLWTDCPLVLLRYIQWEEGGVQHVFFGGSGSPFYWFIAVARSVNTNIKII